MCAPFNFSTAEYFKARVTFVDIFAYILILRVCGWVVCALCWGYAMRNNVSEAHPKHIVIIFYGGAQMCLIWLEYGSYFSYVYITTSMYFALRYSHNRVYFVNVHHYKRNNSQKQNVSLTKNWFLSIKTYKRTKFTITIINTELFIVR